MPSDTTFPTFSLFLPQAAQPYAALRQRALVLEQFGYDGLWLVDHFWAAGAVELDFLEGWSTLAALSEATSRLRLGLLVSCNSYRNPALLAKMAATVDSISEGRLELGMGAGWMEEEYKSYGYPFPSMGVRLAQLGEGLEIVRRLYGDGPASFSGEHFSIDNAVCIPKPVQERLPITIGGAGEKVLLRLVARYADRWNCPMNSAAEIPRLLDVLAGHCAAVGRDPSTIITSEQTVVVLGHDNEQVREKRAIADAFIGSFAELDVVAVQGTADEVVAGLRAKMAGGVKDFTILFGDLGMDDTLELFASDVIPQLRQN